VVHDEPDTTAGGVQVKPHWPETQVARPWGGVGQGMHDWPQLATLVSGTQTVPHWCWPEGQLERHRPVAESQPSAQVMSVGMYSQEPEVRQRPTAAHVRWLAVSRHKGAGGVLQGRAVPMHAPVAPHESFSVQASASLQAAPMSAWYWQTPFTQTPDSKHARAGHVTPAQGSP
jgi:hypothetical protein